MANQIIIALPRVTDANGDPASGALAYFYQTGTTTPITVYSDEALSVAHASPLVADSGGKFAQVFYGGATNVKVLVKDSGGSDIYQLDPSPMISGSSSAAENITFSPVTGNSATDVQGAIENNVTALDAKVDETVTVTAGTGLTGGGDLSANRTLSVDEGDAAALTAGTNAKFPDCATIRADTDASIAALALGIGQTWQSVIGSRAVNTNYRNTTGRPIEVSIVCQNTTAAQTVDVSSNASTWIQVGSTTGGNTPNIFTVPNTWYYRVRETSGTTTIAAWAELR